MVIQLAGLGFDEGAQVLVRLALGERGPGEIVAVRGTHPDLPLHLRTWARTEGHRYFDSDPRSTAPEERSLDDWEGWIKVGPRDDARRSSAEPAGRADPTRGLTRHPSRSWGLASRGVLVEAGGPEPYFALDDGDVIWADSAPRLYAQAAAAQWDPATAIDWEVPVVHDEVIERAVVQVMTFLIENEEAALVVPARFLGQVHPHFREVQQVLAVQVADEARHIEVFTRRAALSGRGVDGLSGAGGRWSLQTLLDEPDYATAAFLLSVLGEGTFLSLLDFLVRHAPDPITASVARLARQDEARHVAFGIAHLERHCSIDPPLRSRLAAAVERRHAALADTAGLNDSVFDALVLLAAGSTEPDAIVRGWRAVIELQTNMHAGRRNRIARLGFTSSEADALSSLHTRNFM